MIGTIQRAVSVPRSASQAANRLVKNTGRSCGAAFTMLIDGYNRITGAFSQEANMAIGCETMANLWDGRIQVASYTATPLDLAASIVVFLAFTAD